MGSIQDNSTPFPFQHRSVDTPRKLRIAIIGAGVSGIGLYIRFRQYVPSAELQIFEKNSDVGGTWFENRYPGVACDIPSHVYQYTFEPNTQWSKFFSGGAEILDYVRGVATKYGVQKSVSFNTRVFGATWNEIQGNWTVEFGDAAQKGRTETQTFDVVISAVGNLNKWKYPEIEGLHDFEGKLLHSATWDPTWSVSKHSDSASSSYRVRDYTNKTVALIGAGSSAIQILPHLQKKCTEVFHYTRGKTWVSEPFGGEATQATIAGDKDSGNYSYTSEELRKFREDPEYYWRYRKNIERFINLDHPCLFAHEEASIASKQRIIENMKTKLAKKPEIYAALEPEFTPGCRRLTPGPGFLEALVEDNVHFTNSKIVRVTKDSIITADGKIQKVDAIVCATGFDTTFLPRFPIKGSNNILLADQWSSHASAYLSTAIPNFPNLFLLGGPNSATGGGSLLIIFESIIGYVVKCVQKISREHIKYMAVKPSSLRSWERYMDAYFPGTVHVENCTSWYKAGQKDYKVVGLWPGSSLHARKTLEFPRWEDFEYVYPEAQDSLGWLGDGWTVADREKGDTAAYLDEVDYPPVLA
ncbi:monooxygenase-3 [Coleophoma cylindrospora]|uniref:Monooxygenase-3 n=1 Tax=Coleophoma cylindrospora TaxID=1849047 RepID=A0A3D8SS66_9HELO|nr:monooxygenase-3 [Coleophoma cylindrospora]